EPLDPSVRSADMHRRPVAKAGDGEAGKTRQGFLVIDCLCGKRRAHVREETLDPLLLLYARLRLSPADELANVTAERFHRLQELGVRLDHLSGEEFHYANAIITDAHREGESAAQADPPRIVQMRQVALAAEVPHPARRLINPYLTGQTLARSEND